MANIDIRQGSLDGGMWKVSFILEEGQYTDDDLREVRSRIWDAGQALFSEDNPSILTVIYKRGSHPGPARVALKVLQRRYPNIKFTTVQIVTKELFGDDVEKVSPV